MRSAIIVTFQTSAALGRLHKALNRTALPVVVVEDPAGVSPSAAIFLMTGDKTKLLALLDRVNGGGFAPRAVIDGSTQDGARLTQVLGTLSALSWDSSDAPSLGPSLPMTKEPDPIVEPVAVKPPPAEVPAVDLTPPPPPPPPEPAAAVPVATPVSAASEVPVTGEPPAAPKEQAVEQPH